MPDLRFAGRIYCSLLAFPYSCISMSHMLNVKLAVIVTVESG